jgi:membrane protein YqaA with SNARE-associated domain
MHRLIEIFHHVLSVIQPLAERFGAPGLAMVAFLDSSFISLPEVGDALIVLLVIQHPSRWLLYSAATTLWSVCGCYALYAIAKKGGESFLRRRFKAQQIDRGLNLFKRHGLLAVIVPSIMPPPTPFKIFVLLAGVAGVRPSTFILAVALGRSFRYVGEAWLARTYGAQATGFIQGNLATISFIVAGVIAVGGVGLVLWRRRHAA